MKKIAKSFLLIAVMMLFLTVLTGCGENKKLVATKDTEDSLYGKYSETVEITFKDKKADKIVMTKDLESQEKANSIGDLLKYLDEDEMNGLKIEQDGKKIITTFEPSTFIQEQNLKESNLSRESLKKELEEEGYKINE
ncbi:MAG: hypothetical protein IJ890_06675 [Clostridia bacterium]|nr:hypothetical protein [Clostridia bacterium]